MRLSILLLAVAATLPALGQDFSVALFSNQSWMRSRAYIAGGPDATVIAGYSSGWLSSNGLQGAWKVAKAGPLGIEVTGSYMFPSTRAVTDATTLDTIAGPVNTTSTAHLRESYGAVGARVAGTLPFLWSAGVEVRRESLRLTNGNEFTESQHNNESVSTDLTRPWVVGRIGYLFPGFKVRPFVTASVGATSAKFGVYRNYDANLVEAMAPILELGIQAGVRF